MATVNAVKTDLACFIGADHRLVCTEEDGTVLTGFALSFMIKRRPSDVDGDALLTLTTGSGAITVSGAVATVAVADTDTDGISAGVYHWVLKRTDAGAETVLGMASFA